MKEKTSTLPLLPLVLDRVPKGLRLALSQEGVPWVSRKASAVAGRFVLFDSKENGKNGRVGPRVVATGQTSIDVDMLRDGEAVDPFEAILDDGAVRMVWKLTARGLADTTVAEEVSRYDKRAIRDRMLRRLQKKVESHDGLWLRLAPVPFPYRTAFHLRVDHDAFNPGDFQRLLDTLVGYESATTHYLNGRALEVAPAEAISRLEGLDVGSHGYYHHTYRSEAENVKNIKRGIDTLGRLGLDPVGFVAPHGRYNGSLQAAMASLDISHSGEFGLTYDDWPFWPVRKEEKSHGPSHDVLQIPVHPICLGLFDDPEKWFDYFVKEAEARCHAGEPLFFYGHPTGRLGRYPELLSQSLATIDRMETVWKTTARRFAEWWRVRAMVKLSVRREGGMILVRREGLRPKFRLAVELFREDRSALIAMEEPELRFSPESIAWQRREGLDSLERPIGRPCWLGLRERFKQAIDWEKETPIDEIVFENWRGLCKRTLRKLLADGPARRF